MGTPSYGGTAEVIGILRGRLKTTTPVDRKALRSDTHRWLLQPAKQAALPFVRKERGRVADAYIRGMILDRKSWKSTGGTARLKPKVYDHLETLCERLSGEMNNNRIPLSYLALLHDHHGDQDKLLGALERYSLSTGRQDLEGTGVSCFESYLHIKKNSAQPSRFFCDIKPNDSTYYGRAAKNSMMISCDYRYFMAFFPSYYHAASRWSESSDYICCNVFVDDENKINDIKSISDRLFERYGANLSLMIFSTPASISQDQRRTLYATARIGFIPREISAGAESVLTTDLDALPLSRPELCRGDEIGLYVNTGPKTFFPWRRVNCQLVYVPATGPGRTFADTLAATAGRAFDREGPEALWWWDQLALGEVLEQLPPAQRTSIVDLGQDYNKHFHHSRELKKALLKSFSASIDPDDSDSDDDDE